MLLRIYNDNPNPRHITQAAEVLRKGGLIIYPTDTVYGLGCDITNAKAVENLCRLKGVKPEKANFSFICRDLSHIADFTKPIPTAIFRLLKAALPGPYTFILNANNNVPRLLSNKKKTVGIRVPDNNICRLLTEELGHPIISTSIKDDDEVVEYSTDPELIYEKFSGKVDLVLDGGYGDNVGSTIIDCTSGEPEVLRVGKGKIEGLIE